MYPTIDIDIVSYRNIDSRIDTVPGLEYLEAYNNNKKLDESESNAPQTRLAMRRDGLDISVMTCRH